MSNYSQNDYELIQEIQVDGYFEAHDQKDSGRKHFEDKTLDEQWTRAHRAYEDLVMAWDNLDDLRKAGPYSSSDESLIHEIDMLGYFEALDTGLGAQRFENKELDTQWMRAQRDFEDMVTAWDTLDDLTRA